jgi:hypothetical protein
LAQAAWLQNCRVGTMPGTVNLKQWGVSNMLRGFRLA